MDIGSLDILNGPGTVTEMLRIVSTATIALALAFSAAPSALAAPSEPSDRPSPQTSVNEVVFSFDALLVEVEKSSKGLASELEEARQLASRARFAKAAASASAVIAGQAAQTASAASKTAELAHAEAVIAQEEVDRWAAAAYRGSDLGLLVATVAQASSPSDYLHTSGLSLHAADYQAYLVETAKHKSLVSSLAQADAVATRLRAELAVSQALDRAEAAEALAQAARLEVAKAEKKLRRSQRSITRLLPGMSLERALGVAREWGDGRLAGLLDQASILKDSRPFVPGSGPNSNERLSEWKSWNPTVQPGSPRAYAVFRLAHFGWSVLEWPCLDRLWWHESGWKVQSTDAMQGTGFGELNPQLTWGIPQANPAIKMADPAQGGGPDWVTNPMTQINWGLTYIKRIYGSPCGAWDAWRARAATGSYGWY